MSDKDDLALCLRMLEHEGIIDYNGHASIRMGEHMLINDGTASKMRMSPDDICLIDMSGMVVEGHGRPPMEFHLHAGIYKARPDVRAIVHAHPQWSTYLTLAGQDYLPVYAQGTLLYPVPLLDMPDSINSAEMGDRLAAVLGDRPAVLMKAHGSAVVGADILEAFTLATYLEENARRQHGALQIGQPYRFTEAERTKYRANLWKPKLFQKAWDHFAAKVGAV